jgi:hypothetical protein
MLFKVPKPELLIAIRAVRGVGCSELVRRLFLVIFMQFIGGQLTILEDLAITTLQVASGNALGPHSHDSLLVLPVMFYLPVRCG